MGPEDLKAIYNILDGRAGYEKREFAFGDSWLVSTSVYAPLVDRLLENLLTVYPVNAGQQEVRKPAEIREDIRHGRMGVEWNGIPVVAHDECPPNVVVIMCRGEPVGSLFREGGVWYYICPNLPGRTAAARIMEAWKGDDGLDG